MDNPLISFFPGVMQMTRAEVGGKADSLIRMSEAGLPVPPGAVFTTAFFKPWLDVIRSTATWTQLTKASVEEWSSFCNELKEHVQSFSLTLKQQNALNILFQKYGIPGDGVYFAVRSSSPGEDLPAASFAGSYETRLGVPPDQLEDALRHCFSSIFDVRVLRYKKEHGFDIRSPAFAVVVQQQLDSEASGVAFSLNPVTNDYDEAVIEANWGLGTSVVEGRISPDRFVVDKIKRQIIQETRGTKHISVWLDANGGTVERKAYRSADRSLTDTQIRELIQLLCRIEDLFGYPVDIEWAYANGAFYVLQTRPITTYVPLPPEMITEPGQRRCLFVDAALSKGLTTNKPISPLGLDFMKNLFSSIVELWGSSLKRDVSPEEAFVFFAGSRMYMNFSNLLWLASPEKLAKSSAPSDALMADILAGVDKTTYRSAMKPAWMHLRTLARLPVFFWRLRRFFWNILYAFLTPERAYQTYRQKIESFESELREQLGNGLPLDEIRRRYEDRMARKMFETAMPALLAGLVTPKMVVFGMDDETKVIADRLRWGTTGNVVVEMGIALYGLAKLLKPSDVVDLDQLAERVGRREMPPAFLEGWDNFLLRFGWRGPGETDLASPRYADDPHLALRQISFLVHNDESVDPETAHQHRIEERRAAYKALQLRLGPLRRMLLRRIYRLIDLFSGTRDTPKHLLVLLGYVVRKRVMAEGRRLTRQGRLDKAEDVFNLTFEDLRAASEDTSADLRAVCEERRRFRNKLDAHVSTFPPVIDSRGRILRPASREDIPGMLSGTPVSPGVVTGPVKVLHTPDEKPVEKGDVLVAYTTDPGWTPLFINASAIVLEIGGVLQHGVVVAREYGKPCVVGIDRVVEKLHDGESVEVDGTKGTVRLLS